MPVLFTAVFLTYYTGPCIQQSHNKYLKINALSSFPNDTKRFFALFCFFKIYITHYSTSLTANVALFSVYEVNQEKRKESAL